MQPYPPLLGGTALFLPHPGIATYRKGLVQGLGSREAPVNFPGEWKKEVGEGKEEALSGMVEQTQADEHLVWYAICRL